MSYKKKAMLAWLLCSISAVAVAEDIAKFGVDLQAERVHQKLEDDSANVTTVDIAPYLQYGNWDFSIDVPWISADANYVNSQYPVRAVEICQNLSQYTNYAQKHPNSRVAKWLAGCNSAGVVEDDETVTGMSDITAFARYNHFLDQQGIWLLSGGVGYKFDNGDVEKNLGSDTRNTLFELGLGASYGKLSASLTGGYVMVDGDDEFMESSYNYASFDIGVSPAAWFTIGGAVDYDQSYYIGTDDVTKVTAYVKFEPSQHVRFKIYTRDFGSADGYPDREYGGSFSLVY